VLWAEQESPGPNDPWYFQTNQGANLISPWDCVLLPVARTAPANWTVPGTAARAALKKFLPHMPRRRPQKIDPAFCTPSESPSSLMSQTEPQLRSPIQYPLSAAANDGSCSAPSAEQDEGELQQGPSALPARRSTRLRQSSVSLSVRMQETTLRPSLQCLCSAACDALLHHICGDVFESPITDEEAPGYSRVVKQPICLGEIATRAANDHYTSWQAFAADVRQCFDNALLYNPTRSCHWLMAHVMKIFFTGVEEALAQWVPLPDKARAAQTHPSSPLPATSIPPPPPPSPVLLQKML